MGFQNRPFNKLSKDVGVIVHGSLVCQVPKEIILTKEGLDELCEKTIAEGFVIVDKDSNQRYKLKRENFSSKDDPEKQRSAHSRSPNKDEYTTEGIKLCGGEGFGYDNAVFNNVKNNTTTMQIDIKNSQVELQVIPIGQAIKFQKEYPFIGDKMMNFYKTEGQGHTYRYTERLENKDILNKNLEFQIKHDGETALLHKDKKGKIHLMIKLQVDVYQLDAGNGSFIYRFGWY